MIFVSLLTISADKVTQETRHEQLSTQNHHCQRDVEIWALRHQCVWLMLIKGDQFEGSHYDNGDESDDEHQRANESEYMHGLHAKGADEP